jgi:putative DNA primase/helicase
MDATRVLQAFTALGVRLRLDEHDAIVYEPDENIPQELKEHAGAVRRDLVALLNGDAADEPAEPPGAERCTDMGNALRFARDHGADVRYCYAMKSWLVWSTRRWRWDTGRLVTKRAKATARRLYRRLAELRAQQADKDFLRAFEKHVRYSQSDAGIRHMLSLAQSEPGVPVELDDLDADPMLLNCTNGTLELTTMTLRPPRREDLITKITKAPYRPDATHPMLDRLLTRVLPDVAVRAFVQRVAGYALTASTIEEKLFIAYGPTNGGKSTVLSALRNALGDYATTADSATFMKRRHEGGQARDDLMALVGRRLVISSEVEDGSRMAESLVKTLFGGDAMSGRALYERTQEFVPVFKLMIAANHRPRARDDDDALWRRIVEIPFTVSIPEAERDPSIKSTLTNPRKAGAAVLAWAAAGCTAWLNGGLAIPDAVKKATAAYRAEMDPITDFLKEACVLENKTEVATGVLKDAYLSWAKDASIREPLGSRAFNERLEAKGLTRNKKRTLWFGIRLRTDTDPVDNSPNPDEPHNEPEADSECSQNSIFHDADFHDAGSTRSIQSTQYRNPPIARAQEESYGEGAPNALSATGDPNICAGCHLETVRASLTEIEGQLWCPLCLHDKGSDRPGGRP